MTPTIRVPVLWLSGPPGAGKSTLGWRLFDELSRQVPLGYVDLDQVGICYATPTPDVLAPEPSGDYGRHRLQARNLNDMLPAFAAAGVAGVVVSGVVDARRGIDVDLLCHAALTTLRLRVAPEELTRRLAARARPDDVEHVLRYAAALEQSAGPTIDTTHATIAEALRLVRERSLGWFRPIETTPGRSTRAPHPTLGRSTSTAGPLLWLSGVTGVGKSTVGWQLYQEISRLGTRCAFVDLQQIGFCRPAPNHDPGNHRLTASNLSAVWDNDRADGAQGLLVVGAVESAEVMAFYSAALPNATITLCRLHASPGQLDERIALRGQGVGPPIVGCELAGLAPTALQRVSARASAAADAQQRAELADLWIATDHRPPRDLAREILRRTDWMGLGDRV